MSDLQVCLNKEQLAKISDAFGGRAVSTGDELVQLVLEALAISVEGAVVQIDPEDAHALVVHFEEFNYGTYEEYVSDTVQEALHMFLWGSTSGRLAYR